MHNPYLAGNNEGTPFAIRSIIGFGIIIIIIWYLRSLSSRHRRFDHIRWVARIDGDALNYELFCWVVQADSVVLSVEGAWTGADLIIQNTITAVWVNQTIIDSWQKW